MKTPSERVEHGKSTLGEGVGRAWEGIGDWIYYIHVWNWQGISLQIMKQKENIFLIHTERL